MGLLITLAIFLTLPNGKLIITFCDVGQGDSAYIQFPDGRDMVIDGGPSPAVLSCLGRHMPFWDRHIDLVLVTHPEKDHFEGVTHILRRYRVDYLLQSDVDNVTESYKAFLSEAAKHTISIKHLHAGDQMKIGPVSFL